MTLWHTETSSRCHQELDQRITTELHRERTWMRDPISPGLKLAVNLRHLAGGDSYTPCSMPSGWPVRPSTSLSLMSDVYHQGLSRSADAVPHTPRLLVAGRVHLLLEKNHSACPGCPGWKAYSNQMSTRGRQPLPQLQGVPLYGTLGPDGWRLQVPLGGGGGCRVKL